VSTVSGDSENCSLKAAVRRLAIFSVSNRIFGFVRTAGDRLTMTQRFNQRIAAHFIHEYKVRPRKDHRGVDLISDALPFGRLWYGEPNAVRIPIGTDS
jgi:hypothetical protein